MVRMVVSKRTRQFQSTLPHGERPRGLRPLPDPCGFNPRSRMGSDREQQGQAKSIRRFNPRSRMGSDTLTRVRRSRRAVSIHAPAWGATAGRGAEARRMVRFNPRSRMGSDTPRQHSLNTWTRFNPRSRMGSDKLSKRPHTQSCCFNPRSRMGSDADSFEVCFLRDSFQSTLPHGERRGS